MSDVEREIAHFLHEEADRVTPSREMYQRVLRRATIRRVVTAAIAGVGAIAIATAGILTAGALRTPPVVGPAAPDPLPTPPGSLRERVPSELDEWVGSGLVLVYEKDGVYHLFREGVLPHSCPKGVPERYPEACFSTAQHFMWDRSSPDVLSIRSHHDLRLVDPPQGSEVLWRGFPVEGSIGIRSPGACDRLARFDDHYVCRDGQPAYVPPEDREPKSDDRASRGCPVLLPPGVYARERAQAAARAWARSRLEDLPHGTRFDVEVERAGGDPLGECSRRSIPTREETWTRTWIAQVHWIYPKGSHARLSASVASSTICLGRTPTGWQVYYRFH